MDNKNTDRIGEHNINTQGLKMWVKEYRKADDIDVEFEDGYIAYNKTYYDFKRKLIGNKNYKKPRSNENTYIKINRIGETNYNKFGEKMTIIEYRGVNDITIKFENGCIIYTYYKLFSLGEARNPFSKTILNHGYIGTGKENSKTNTLAYKHWYSMLQRCYSEKFKQKQPQYKDNICCDEWLNFQNFAEWFNQNYYEVNNERMHLGKDILVKGNKIYSYETCVFVPQRINELFTKRQNERGDYPIGVSLHESQNRLRVRCNDGFGKTINLGYFENSKKGVIKIKRLAILLMLFSFTLVSCESNKGEWKNEDNNWYYFYSNGEMAHDCYIGNYYLGYNGALTNDVPKPVPPPEVKLYKHISVKITKIQQEYYFRGTFKVYIEYQSDEYGLKESTTIGNNEPYAYECFSGQYKVGDSIQAIMYSWQQGDTVTKRQLGNLDYN